MEPLKERISVRLPDSLYFLLQRLSKEIGLNVSEMLRQAIVAWLQELPEDTVPMPLRVPITRLAIQSKMGEIKNTRYIYHAKRKAQKMLKELDRELSLLDFPQHAIEYLRRLELELIEMVNGFDSFLEKETIIPPKTEDPEKPGRPEEASELEETHVERAYRQLDEIMAAREGEEDVDTEALNRYYETKYGMSHDEFKKRESVRARLEEGK